MELAALRLVEVPDSAPPYDCEAHGASCPSRREPGWPGDASLTEPGSEARPAPARPAVSPGGADLAVSPAAAGTAAAWPRQYAQVMVEILAGVRPVRQVVPWATEYAQAQIRRLIPGFAADRRPTVQRVLTSRPASGVVEVTVVADFGPRTRALAIRFEQVAARRAVPGLPPRPARWLCAAIEAG